MLRKEIEKKVIAHFDEIRMRDGSYINIEDCLLCSAEICKLVSNKIKVLSTHIGLEDKIADTAINNLINELN